MDEKKKIYLKAQFRFIKNYKINRRRKIRCFKKFFRLIENWADVFKKYLKKKFVILLTIFY